MAQVMRSSAVVMSGNENKGFRRDLPILPFKHYIIAGYLPVQVRLFERAFMHCDVFEAPDDGTLLIMLNIFYNFITGNGFLSFFVIIDGAQKLNPGGIVS
jgi:hypothetical protein